MNTEEIAIGLSGIIRKEHWVIGYDDNVIQLKSIRPSAIVDLIEIDINGTTTITANGTSTTIRAIVNSPESAKEAIMYAMETILLREKSILNRLEKTMSGMA